MTISCKAVRAAAAVLAMMAAAAAAGAQESGALSAADPEGLTAALRDLGYRARLEKDGAGDPLIRSATGGTDFAIVFFGCAGGTGCKSLLFNAGLDLAQGASPRLVNAWNAENIVGAAYLDDENDPFLQMFVTTEGGLTRENFASWVQWWDASLAQFKRHVGF